MYADCLFQYIVFSNRKSHLIFHPEGCGDLNFLYFVQYYYLFYESHQVTF